MQDFDAESSNLDLLRIFLTSEMARLETFAHIVHAASRDGRTRDAEIADARWTHIFAGVKEILSILPPDEQAQTGQQLAALEVEFNHPYYRAPAKPNREIRLGATRVKHA